jgi:hypothetical protein
MWNGFEMSGVHTVPNATQMVDLVSVGDWTDEQRIGQDMHPDVLPVERDLSVSLLSGMEFPRPEPMRWAFSHPRPEAGGGLIVSPREETPASAVTSVCLLGPLKRNAALLTGKVEGHRGYLRGVRSAADDTVRRPFQV